MWDAGGRDNGIAYADILRLRIYSVPKSLVGPALRRCEVRSRRGGRIVLHGNHYLRLGVVEDRRDAYVAFVDALVRRVAAANPGVMVTLGQSLLMWSIWLAILAGIAVMVLLAVAVLAEGNFPLQAVLYVAIALGFAPMAWRAVRHGRPRRVAPADFSVAMLG